MSGGDSVDVVERPRHGITIGLVYRALMLQKNLLTEILAADALPEDIRATARRRAAAG